MKSAIILFQTGDVSGLQCLLRLRIMQQVLVSILL